MSTTNHAPVGRLFGYARVSSTDQDLTIQRERLMAAGSDIIRTEKVSGTSLKGRNPAAHERGEPSRQEFAHGRAGRPGAPRPPACCQSYWTARASTTGYIGLSKIWLA